MSSDSFGARSTLTVSGREYEVFRLDALRERFDVALSKIRPTRPYLFGEATLRPADDIVRAIDTGNECRSIHQGWQCDAAAEADFEHAI